jgi:hypothetical protein
LTQAAKQSDVDTNSTATPTLGDQFTPATQSTEQDAGLFTVNQISLFSPAAAALIAPAIASALATPATAKVLGADTNTGPAPTVATREGQLQTLNSALNRLGLSNANISKIDRIADVTQNFNPEAFSILARQLLAQQGNQDATAATAPAQTKAASG